MVISQPAIICLQRATDDLVARGVQVGHSARGLLRRTARPTGGSSAPDASLATGQPLGLPFLEPTRARDARLERERVQASGSA
jgi:hypothetical protein